MYHIDVPFADVTGICNNGLAGFEAEGFSWVKLDLGGLVNNWVINSLSG